MWKHKNRTFLHLKKQKYDTFLILGAKTYEILKSVDICENASPKPAGIVNQVEKDGEIDLRRYISHAAKGHKLVLTQ